MAAHAATVGVDVAENQRLLATVNTPTSGVVVNAPTVGDVLAPGATIAMIREGDATSPCDVAFGGSVGSGLSGSEASVYADWMTGDPLGAMITLIGDQADYPPTAFATDEVHRPRQCLYA